MKKLETKELRDKKKKRSKIIVGGVFILLMILSSAGYAFQGYDGSKQKKIEYNGYEFVGNTGSWITNIGSIYFNFIYNPKQTDNLEGEFDSIDEYYGEKVYIYSQSYSAEEEIRKNLEGVSDVENACLEGYECNGEYPIKTCEERVIIITYGEQKVREEGKCVHITGEEDVVVRLTDAFLFKILGIKG